MRRSRNAIHLLAGLCLAASLGNPVAAWACSPLPDPDRPVAPAEAELARQAGESEEAWRDRVAALQADYERRMEAYLAQLEVRRAEWRQQQAAEQERRFDEAANVLLVRVADREWAGEGAQQGLLRRVTFAAERALKGEATAGEFAYTPIAYPGMCERDPYFEGSGGTHYLVFDPGVGEGTVRAGQLLGVSQIVSERLRDAIGS